MKELIIFLKNLCERLGLTLFVTAIKSWFTKTFRKDKTKKTLKQNNLTLMSRSSVTETITEQIDTTVNLKFFKSHKRKLLKKTTKNGSRSQGI